MTLYICRMLYGQAFVLNDELIHYLDENDGNWSAEFYDPILKACGVVVEYKSGIGGFSDKVIKQISKYEE